MAQVSFRVNDSNGSAVEFFVNVYGELYPSDDFDPEQEEMMMFMGIAESPAYFLWKHWSELCSALSVTDSDAGVLFAQLLSKTTEPVRYIYESYQENQGNLVLGDWGDFIANGLGCCALRAFEELNDRVCIDIARFIKEVGLSYFVNLYDTQPSIKQRSSWKLDFEFQRFLDIGEHCNIGPWNVYGSVEVPDMFWIDGSSVTVGRSGPQPYSDGQLKIIDEMFRLFLPYYDFKYDAPSGDSYADYVGFSPPSHAGSSKSASHGLLYNRVRPHKHDRRAEPCSKYSPRVVFVLYDNVRAATKAYHIAVGMNDNSGACYSIKMMKRIKSSELEHDAMEDKLLRTRRDHSRIGGLEDWLAQNWEEI